MLALWWMNDKSKKVLIWNFHLNFRAWSFFVFISSNDFSSSQTTSNNQDRCNSCTGPQRIIWYYLTAWHLHKKLHDSNESMIRNMAFRRLWLPRFWWWWFPSTVFTSAFWFLQQFKSSFLGHKISRKAHMLWFLINYMIRSAVNFPSSFLPKSSLKSEKVIFVLRLKLHLSQHRVHKVAINF